MPLDIPATLGRKYGPLPGYAWMAIAAGGTYIVIRRRRSSTAGASSSTTAAAEDLGQAGGGDQSGYQTGAGYDYGGIPTGPTDAGLTTADLAGLEAAEGQQTAVLRKVLKRLKHHPAASTKKPAKPPHKATHKPPPAKGHPKSAKPHNPRRPKPPARKGTQPRRSTTTPNRRP